MTRPTRTLERARHLRREATEVERSLWEDLRARRLEGRRFRRQHPIGPYVLDFYCSDARLCVEVDGSGHLATEEHDAARTAWLAAQVIRVVRFWNDEIARDRALVLQRIADAAAEPLDGCLASTPSGLRPPSPLKRGRP